MASLESNDSLEASLGPPSFDFVGLGLALLASLVSSLFTGVFILVLSFLSYGDFSLGSGASPILLAIITFLGLTFGSYIYVYILTKIWPTIYSNSRIVSIQITVVAVILYLLFTPVYIIIGNLAREVVLILLPFAFHILFHVFSVHLTMGLVSTYRYALLTLYASIASFVLTGLLLAFIFYSSAQSSTTLFVMLGLVIAAEVLSTGIKYSLLALYSLLYRSTWLDPIGGVFSKIEEEERQYEKEVTQKLTHF